MTKNDICKLVDLVSPPKEFPLKIFHYTDTDTVNRILSQKGVSFKFTHIDSFDDKLEGKTIDRFYQMAISKLLKENAITCREAEMLCDIRSSDISVPWAFMENGKHSKEQIVLQADAFVACFSKSEKDEYMFSNYIKTADKKGYCISLLADNLFDNETTQTYWNGYRFLLYPVMYGKDVVLNLCCFIKEFLECVGGVETEDFRSFKFLIENKLSILRYSAKLRKYKKENEIRMILLQGNGLGEYTENNFSVETSNGREYILVPFPKNVVLDIYKSRSVEDDEHRSFINELGMREYPFAKR